MDGQQRLTCEVVFLNLRAVKVRVTFVFSNLNCDVSEVEEQKLGFFFNTQCLDSPQIIKRTLLSGRSDTLDKGAAITK